MTTRKTNKAGIDMLKKIEGCELTAYPDPSSPLAKQCFQNKIRLVDYKKLPDWPKFSGAPWTIGYGNTGPDVRPGTIWTQEQADDKLKLRLTEFEGYVNSLVKIPITDNQFAALVSLCYNCGPGGLIKLINGQPGPIQSIKWISDNIPEFRINKGTLSEQGLRNRRRAEQALFNS